MCTQKGRCPNCGGAMVLGHAQIFSLNNSGVLNWISEEKMLQYKKSFFTGEDKETYKRKSFTLMSESLLNNETAEAWYCSICEKVFASFDVKERDK